MSDENKLKVGFTKSAAVLYLCQPECNAFFKKQSATANIYDLFAKSDKNTTNYKIFCKEILAIYAQDRNEDDSKAENSILAEIINNRLRDPLIIVRSTLRQLDSEKPHLIISFPYSNDPDTIEIKPHHVFLFMTCFVKQQYWMDTSLFYQVSEKKIKVDSCRVNDYCELKPYLSTNKNEKISEELKDIVNSIYRQFGGNYPSLYVLRPTQIDTIIQFVANNWVRLKESMMELPDVRDEILRRNIKLKNMFATFG